MIAPVPTDHKARQRLRTDLDSTLFVEAGAGTGKTTALVGRMVELVAAGKLQLDRLAAITFTEAAAAELRDRVRQELEKAASGRENETERARCGEASREVDVAAIQTLHAFAGSLLRTYPLESGLPPGFATLDELQQEHGLDDRFRAWLYDEVPGDASPDRRASLQRVLALGMTFDQVRELATRLQDYRDLLDPETAWTGPAPRDPVEAANRWGQTLVGLANCAHEALDSGDRLVEEIGGLQFVARRMVQTKTDDEALRLLQQCTPKQAGNARNWPTGRCKEIKATLQECATEIDLVLSAHRGAALADLLRYLRDFTLAYAGERLQRGEATFHDLLTWARDLLRDNPEARRRAQARFDRIFVDEFQDTDPLQVEIAWFLASEPEQASEHTWTKLRLVPGKLFIVGDPKQSIYRFRRADIGIYHDVYQQLEKETDRVVLSHSFRSPEPLVAWFNHHFSTDILHEERVQPAYAPLSPRRPVELEPEEAGFGVRHMGDVVERAGPRWMQEAQAVARLARQIVEGPRPWRTASGPARYSDVCVLLPSRINLRRLERAFRTEGVPYRMESGWLVLHTQEVRDLLSCLRAIDDPSDQVALVGALRSPAYACSDVDLLRWIDAGGRLDYESSGQGCHGPVRKAFESLRVFHDQRMDRTPAATTEAFVRERMLAVQAFGDAHPRDSLRRLRYVVAQARTLAASGQSTLRALCDWLESRQRDTPYDVESALPEADEEAVRFLTVHGSKGLELPIVILTGLGVATSRAGPSSVDLVPNYSSGVLDVRCGAFNTTGYQRDTEKHLDEAEQRRLLYVAATRARDHLVLSLYRGKEACHASRIMEQLAKAPDLSRELNVADRPRMPSSEASSVLEDGALMTPAEHREAEERWVADRQRLIARLSDQTVVSPSSLAHEPEPGPAFADPPPEPDANDIARPSRRGRGGTALGRAVHSVLQTIDLATLDRLAHLAAAAAEEEGLSARAGDVSTYVRSAAESAPVQRALASGRYWREVPVGVALEDGSLLEGAMDLVYEDADGALRVVDYKTDNVTEQEVTARAEHYRAQGEAYATGLTQATGRKVDIVEFVFAALAGRVVAIQPPQRS